MITKILLAFCLSLLAAIPSRGESYPFSIYVKGSLVFRKDSQKRPGDGDSILVFLRIENIHDCDVFWCANSVTDVEVELLGPDGKPVPDEPGAFSIMSSDSYLLLPYGSRLDWLISRSLPSSNGKYPLAIGSKLWLIPKELLESYSLRVRLLGFPWVKDGEKLNQNARKVLLNIPPAKLSFPATHFGSFLNH